MALPSQGAGPRPADPVSGAGGVGEAALDPAEAMRFVDRAPDGVLMVDEHGVIRYANAAARDLLGTDDGPLVGRELGFPLAAADAPMEVELRGRDGSVRAAEMRLTPVGPAGAGGATGHVVAVRDVTGRVEAARALLAAVQQRDDALAVTSHELRNPLAVLASTSQALADSWGELPAIRRLELVRRLNRQIFLISDTVERVLDAARLDAGLFRPEPEPVPLLDLVVDGLPSLPQRPASLEVQVDEDATVAVDAEHAWTVLSNLLTNAVTFAGTGPVVVRGWTDGDWTTLVVADQGPGVPSTDRERIFGRYERLDLSSAEGTGLGLWIVRTVVEAYGGSVRCEAGPDGRGAAFVVRLPSAGSAREPDARG